MTEFAKKNSVMVSKFQLVCFVDIDSVDLIFYITYIVVCMCRQKSLLLLIFL